MDKYEMPFLASFCEEHWMKLISKGGNSRRFRDCSGDDPTVQCNVDKCSEPSHYKECPVKIKETEIEDQTLKVARDNLVDKILDGKL